MSCKLHFCRLCGGLPRRDSFSNVGSAIDELQRVHFVECMSQGCNNAEFGDTPEEAIRTWNAANPENGANPMRQDAPPTFQD